jgi:GTP-binding protein
MKVKSSRFIKGISGSDEILSDGKFQVAFMGRSNVGKSTLINSLAQRKSLARSSSTPGKTIRMDFFLINESFYFVDFPGYGYAKHSFHIRERLAKMMLWYLMYSEITNRLIVLIIDAKVGITALDHDMLKTLNEFKVNHIIIANKIDNLKMGQKEKLIAQIQNDYPGTCVIPYSSKRKYKSGDVLKQIASYTG